MVRVAAVVVLVAVVVAASYTLASGHGAKLSAPPTLPPGSASEPVPVQQWAQQAAGEATRVLFRSTTPAGVQQTTEVMTLGNLSAADKMSQREGIVGAAVASYSRWEAACAAPGNGPNGQKTAQDAADEMNILLMAKRHEARLRMLDSDQYLTVDSQAKDVEKLVIPSGTMRTVTYGAGTIGGRSVDLVFFVPQDAPEVAVIRREMSLLDQAAQGEDVEKFNALPFDERKKRYDMHVESMARFREIVNADVSQGAAQSPDRANRIEACVAGMLPSSWVVDTSSYCARLASR